MDISTAPYKSMGNQSGPFRFVLYRTMLGIFRRLVGIFTLSEEDRLQAGIYIGGEGRDA
jgi:hypothetical protein